MNVLILYLIWHIRCYDIENKIIGFLIMGEVIMGIMEVVFTKKCDMCNAYARITVLAY